MSSTTPKTVEETRGTKPWEVGFAIEGWITREGKFLACGAPGELAHPDLARFVLGPDGEKRADQLGWLRISDYGDRCTKALNQKQLDTLFDYCEWAELDYAETFLAIKYL